MFYKFNRLGGRAETQSLALDLGCAWKRLISSENIWLGPTGKVLVEEPMKYDFSSWYFKFETDALSLLQSLIPGAPPLTIARNIKL